MKLNIRRNYGLMLVAASLSTLWMTPVVADESDQPAVGVAPFAQVGSALISQVHYDAVYYEASREKYYHGTPPEPEVAKMQREVGDKLVKDTLLALEAKRRNVEIDSGVVQERMDAYERRAGSEWSQVREQMLPQLKKQIEEEELVKALEEEVKNVGEPSDKQLRQYYADHSDLFTQPEQIRVSRILIAVLPGADRATWGAARNKILDIVKKVEMGAEFGDMAAEHSDDESSKNNMGDMGYLHGGMLADASQGVVDDMKVGDVSEPIVTTDGVSVVKLTARDPASLNSFDNIKERAAGLWQRDEGEKALATLIADLKAKTRIWVNEARYLPLAAEDSQ